MKRLYSLFFLLSIALAGIAQKPVQEVRYAIQATLHPNLKTIDGQWDATYVNRADTALHSIWIHLYPNAFSSDRTHYSEDLLKWGNTDFYFGNKEDRGGIDSLDFMVDGENVNWNKNENTELVELQLSKPLLPNDSVHISTTFFTQIPFNFEKEGYRENDFILKAWCPLIAELNNKGWQPKPYSLYLKNESAPADFIVELNVPNNYTIKTNGTEINSRTFQYKGAEGFQWMTSTNKSWVQSYSLGEENKDSLRTIIAKKIFPDVFNSRRAPENPSRWLGQVYSNYKRPVPFLEDSFYYTKDTCIDRKIKLGFLYDFRHTDQYKYLFVSPAVGFNNYDKVMVGALVHNYQLPQQPFSFALAPMYATGSKRFAGWGQMDYNIWNANAHWQIGLAGSTFSMSDFDIADYPKFYQRMWRVVPSVSLTLFDNDGASTRKWDFGLRSFILSQQHYTSSLDNNGQIAFSNLTWKTTLFQANAQIQDTRKLYPYAVAAVADAGKEFLRLGVTGKYFFNYNATNRGVSARLFAGKFFYLKNQTMQVAADNSPYNFMLSGPSGSANYHSFDYTYSDYFIGRSESTGWMSQQIMERDGFFKIPTTFGTSDDWLSALNLTADFPKQLDPLQRLNSSLKLFFDIGTYSDLWSDVPPAGRFLYDAGLQVSLCKSLVNIYVPLIYSKTYKDRLPSENRFWKTVSFNINLSAFNPRNRSFLWPQ